MGNPNVVADIVDELYVQCRFALVQNEVLLSENARLRREVLRLQQQVNQWRDAAVSALFALEQVNNVINGLAETQNRIAGGEYSYMVDDNLPRREL